MARVWNAYLTALARWPLRAKVMTGLVITGTGDIVAQTIEGREKFDTKRLLTFSLYGFFITGGFNHFYFRALDNYFGPQLIASIAIKKVAVDLILQGPIEMAVFLAWTHFGNKREGSFLGKLKQDYLEVVVASTCFWGPASMGNFRFVPEHLKVLYVCMCNILWYSYGSFICHKEVKA